jgi:hypothetical protein
MIYSPSQTKSFLQCPQKRAFEQEGFTERMVSKRDWAAWIGQGVHAGLAARPEVALHVGKAEFEAEYGHALNKGRIIPPQFYKGEGLAQVERCLEYAQKHPLIPEITVIETEKKLDTYNCILDVVGTKGGKPTFADWKIKLNLKSDYYDAELEKYRYDWKEARHYPYALSEVMGERVEEYTIVIFVLGPTFKVLQRTYKVNWPVVERWYDGVRDYTKDGLWDTMASQAEWQSNNCHPGAYGFPCEFLEACWTYNTDRDLMKQGGYIQIERRQ